MPRQTKTPEEVTAFFRGFLSTEPHVPFVDYCTSQGVPRETAMGWRLGVRIRGGIGGLTQSERGLLNARMDRRNRPAAPASAGSRQRSLQHLAAPPAATRQGLRERLEPGRPVAPSRPASGAVPQPAAPTHPASAVSAFGSDMRYLPPPPGYQDQTASHATPPHPAPGTSAFGPNMRYLPLPPGYQDQAAGQQSATPSQQQWQTWQGGTQRGHSPGRSGGGAR